MCTERAINKDQWRNGVKAHSMVSELCKILIYHLKNRLHNKQYVFWSGWVIPSKWQGRQPASLKGTTSRIIFKIKKKNKQTNSQNQFEVGKMSITQSQRD